MPKHLIAPSLLASDLGHLADSCALIQESEADWLHYDVMDGQFVPNISLGIPTLEAARKHLQKPIDVHLMIERPERHIEAFRKAGADHITVHVETCPHLHRTIQQIKDCGALAGVALNPSTPPVAIEEVLEDVDIILVMSVNPGFGGQKFIYRSLHKIETLRSMLDVRNLNPWLAVDGGIGPQNAQAVLQAGANALIAGSSVFGAADPARAIRHLKGTGHDLSQWV